MQRAFFVLFFSLALISANSQAQAAKSKSGCFLEKDFEVKNNAIFSFIDIHACPKEYETLQNKIKDLRAECTPGKDRAYLSTRSVHIYEDFWKSCKQGNAELKVACQSDSIQITFENTQTRKKDVVQNPLPLGECEEMKKHILAQLPQDHSFLHGLDYCEGNNLKSFYVSFKGGVPKIQKASRNPVVDDASVRSGRSRACVDELLQKPI